MEKDPKYLYHYTDFNGLKGILDTEELWFTDRRSLNDSNEFVYLSQMLQNIIRSEVLYQSILRELPYIQSHNLEKIKETVSNLSRALYEKILSKLDSAYILSFSAPDLYDEIVQHNGLLSMWRGYGKPGGYALKFQRDNLMDFTQHKQNNKGIDFFHHRVWYIKDSNSEADTADIKDYIEDFTKFLKIIIPDMLGPSNFESENDVRDYHIQAIINLLAFIKHFGFHEENEYRMLVVDINNQLPITVHEKNGRLKLHTKLKYTRESLISIIIGPQRDQETKKHYLEEYLKQNGFNSTEVTISNIPYLG